MRYLIIGLALGLAAPAFASEKCDRFEDVTNRVCIRSFSIALDRDLSSYSGKRQEEENNFAGQVCSLALGYIKQMCNADMGKGRTVSECEFISNIVEGTMRGGCMDIRDQSAKLDKIFHIVGKNQRAAICKKATAQAKAVTLRTCG
jgi:hypothetical protein